MAPKKAGTAMKALSAMKAIKASKAMKASTGMKSAMKPMKLSMKAAGEPPPTGKKTKGKGKLKRDDK